MNLERHQGYCLTTQIGIKFYPKAHDVGTKMSLASSVLISLIL